MAGNGQKNFIEAARSAAQAAAKAHDPSFDPDKPLTPAQRWTSNIAVVVIALITAFVVYLIKT